MDAIVLAAGRGTRMGALTQHIPKCPLDVKDGGSIIEHQLMAMEQTGGIDRVLLVLGHQADRVEATLSRMASRIPVDVVYNPFYDEVNALASLWLALQRRPREFIVLDGDTVFNATCFGNLIAAPRTEQVCLLFSRKGELSDDAVKMGAVDGVLTAIGKEVPRHLAFGESAGMVRFVGSGAEIATRTIEGLMRERANRRRFWYTLIGALIEQRVAVSVRECASDTWFEIDSPEDLDFTRSRLGEWYRDGTLGAPHPRREPIVA